MANKVRRITEIPLIPNESISNEDSTIILDEETQTTKRVKIGALLQNLTGSTINVSEISASTITGDGSQITNLSIGQPEDGTYTDGLFKAFTPTTSVGTAIDRFNEVLKGLSPQPAPDLVNLESQTNSLSMRVSFDQSFPVTDYANVEQALSVEQAPVQIGQQFSAVQGSGLQYKRLGVFSQPQLLQLILNSNTTEDSSPGIVNYPDDSFNSSPDGVEQYIIEMNEQVLSIEEILSLSQYSGQNLELSEARNAKFLATGIEFELYKNRTGTINVPLLSWRKGHNYIKITQVSSLGQYTTNYVDWVYDPSAYQGTTDDYIISSQVVDLAVQNQKTISGIKYYTSLEYYFSASIENYYKNVYPSQNNGGIIITNVQNYKQATIEQFSNTPPPQTANDVLQRSSLHQAQNIRLLGESLSTRMSVDNGLGKFGYSVLTTPTALLDNISDIATSLEEIFCEESKRVPVDIYNDQASLQNAVFIFSNPLADGDLIVYDGKLKYPTNIVNGGNIEGSTIALKHASQPNYSGFVQDGYYMRKFINIPQYSPTIRLSVSGYNVNFVSIDTPFPATPNTLDEQNMVKISFKIPGKTGWRDIKTPYGFITSEDIGCLDGNPPSNLTSLNTETNCKINWGIQGLLPNELFIIRIIASKNWNGYISNLAITF